MIASITPLHFMVLAHMLISLPCPLMIVLAKTISLYTSDMLPYAISVTYGNSLSNLTTPS